MRHWEHQQLLSRPPGAVFTVPTTVSPRTIRNYLKEEGINNWRYLMILLFKQFHASTFCRAAKVPLLSARNKAKRLRWARNMKHYRHWNKVWLYIVENAWAYLARLLLGQTFNTEDQLWHAVSSAWTQVSRAFVKKLYALRFCGDLPPNASGAFFWLGYVCSCIGDIQCLHLYPGDNGTPL